MDAGFHEGGGDMMDDQGGEGDVNNEHVERFYAFVVQFAIPAQDEPREHADGQGNQLGHDRNLCKRNCGARKKRLWLRQPGRW